MISKLRHDWDEYFFGLRSATSLGLFRVLFGIMVLSWCVLIYPDLRTWYTERGFFTLDAMHAWNLNPVGFSVLTLRSWTLAVFGRPLFADVTSYGVVLAIFWLLVIGGVMLTLGYKSRFASVLVAVLLVSFHHRAGIILNGGDTLMRNMALLLILADSGAAVSIDRLINIRRGKCDPSSPAMIESWPQRLMQLQLAAVYLSTCLSKLTGSYWRDGTASYYSSQLTDLQRFSMHGLTTEPWFFLFSTYYTLFAEFSMGTMIFSRRLRPYAMILGLTVHAGIEYSMVVPLFSFTIVSCYLNFVPQDWIDGLVQRLHNRFKKLSIDISEYRVPSTAARMILALDSLSLIRISSNGPKPRSEFSEGLVNRIFWRFPAVWALVLTPLVVVILIRALPSFLIATGIIWPILVVAGVRILSTRFSRFLNANRLSGTERNHSAETDSAPDERREHAVEIEHPTIPV